MPKPLQQYRHHKDTAFFVIANFFCKIFIFWKGSGLWENRNVDEALYGLEGGVANEAEDLEGGASPDVVAAGA